MKERMKLIRYDTACRALAACTKVDEAKSIRDKAVALEAYYRQRHDAKMEAYVSRIRLRAVRRIGELSRDLEKALPGRKGKIIGPNGGTQKRAVLKSIGISKSEANRCEQVAGIPTKEFESYIAAKEQQQKPTHVGEVLRAIVRQKMDDERKGILFKKTVIPAGLHVGDFRELSPKHITDNSVELIFTDPPYDRESVPLYGVAAKEAARILKPGGSMIAYVGHVNIPAVSMAMSEYLTYFWICASLRSTGNVAQIIRLGIEAAFIPLLWFVKERRGDTQTFVRDVVTGDRQKDHHDWQQHIEDAEHFISHLTKPGGSVVDFFVGGGTTLMAAKKLSRNWIGFEIDQAAANAASKRLLAQ